MTTTSLCRGTPEDLQSVFLRAALVNRHGMAHQRLVLTLVQRHSIELLAWLRGVRVVLDKVAALVFPLGISFKSAVHISACGVSMELRAPLFSLAHLTSFRSVICGAQAVWSERILLADIGAMLTLLDGPRWMLILLLGVSSWQSLMGALPVGLPSNCC